MNACTRGAGALLLTLSGLAAFAQQPFTIQQVLSAPYATLLTAAPVGHRFAWVEDAEGRHNLWVSDGNATASHTDARELTHFTDDDAQDILSIAFSPDGNTLAFTRGAELGADDHPANPAHLQPSPHWQIFTVAASGAAPTLLAGGSSPLFTRDGRSILFLHDHQIWIAELAPDAPPHQLVFDRGEASHLTLSPDGRLLAFISSRGHGAREHSYLALFDLTTKTLTFPAPSSDLDSAPAFSPDGKRLAWLRSPIVTPRAYIPNRASATPWSIQLLDLTTNTARTAFAPEPNKPGSVLPRMSTGSPQLFWTADDHILFPSEADGWVHLYALNVTHADAAPRLLTPGELEVEDVSLNADHSALLYASDQATTDRLDRDRHHLWRLDLHHLDSAPSALTHGITIETRPTPSADGTLLAALVSDAQHPMHPALINADGTLTPLNNDTPATFPAAQLITPQQVLFPTEGLTEPSHGQLFLPPHLDNTHKHAALLFFHGGPRRQMLLGFPPMDYYSNAYAMNQYLASRGFIVLSVNYRGGIGYGLNFREAENYGPHGASEYNDALAAAKYLRSRADVDPARIGVWGGSYGGYFTALALARNSDLFAAGVDFHGVHEWIREDNAADWLRDGGAFQSLAEQERIAALAHASSPMADVDKWRSPVLLIHGDNDPDVAYTQTPSLADALRARNVHVEELIFPDELHGFVLHRDWLRSYEAAAGFFLRTLHPER